MKDTYSLYFMKESEFDYFWQWRDKYMVEDILPHATFSESTEKDYEWFFSDAYREEIAGLFTRKVDPLEIVFLQDEKHNNIGFIVYAIYHSEDGKCFILDFCINEEYRNKNVGTAFFSMIKKHVIEQGSTYFALNLTNENNKRFWQQQGFVKASMDEFDSYVYEFYPSLSNDT